MTIPRGRRAGFSVTGSVPRGIFRPVDGHPGLGEAV